MTTPPDRPQNPSSALTGALSAPIPFHPLLAAVPALLSYTHDNRGMASWTSALGPLVTTWIGMLPFWALFVWMSRSRAAAAASTTMVVVAFHAHQFAGKHAQEMWLAVLVVTILLSRLRGPARPLTTFANLLTTLAVVPGILETVADERENPAPHVRPHWEGALDSVTAASAAAGNRPDIWYIVLDGYGREDVLREQYGIDSGLAAELRTRGFRVANQARANYAQTALSFAATLNMEPLDALLVDADPSSTNRRPLMALIRNNRVVRALRAAGYRIVEYPSEYSITHLAAPDDVRGTWFVPDEYEYSLLGHTPVLAIARALGLQQHRVAHEAHRYAVSGVFDSLEDGDRAPGPTFHYAHIVAPHPPFVFAADGSYRVSRSRNFFGDGATWQKYAARYKESYEEGYAAQSAYVDRRLLAALDAILAEAKTPPIILVQGDHGPGARLNWNDPAGTDMRERMSILSAYLVPDSSAIPASITPVDSFRVVLNQALGTDLPLIGGQSWFSSFSTPYTFIDVTDRLNPPPAPIP